uniref:Uncharacterized protein n=1 Tax=Anguilla anguilla TaxID=7936 RepID=A0A0E9U2L6_ANGAN
MILSVVYHLNQECKTRNKTRIVSSKGKNYYDKCLCLQGL